VSAIEPGFRDRLLFDSVRQVRAALALSSISVIANALRLGTVRLRRSNT
jgi:hypothetical protein